MFGGAPNLTSINLSGWDTRSVRDMRVMFGNNLSQLTLGENFVFRPFWRVETHWIDAPLPNFDENGNRFIRRWQNVGNGTVDNPQGEFVFTADELMSNFDGAIHADTWVWHSYTLPITDDEIRIYFDGERLTFDVPPTVIDGEVMIDDREHTNGTIFEMLGATVENIFARGGIGINDISRGQRNWAVRERYIIGFQTNSTEMIVGTFTGNPLEQGYNIPIRNERIIEIDVPPQNVGWRTVLPIRAFAENLGFNVDWCDDMQTLTITTN